MAETKKSETKEVVINLDTFAIPLAIIIAGVIIALGIFFANKNAATKGTANTNDTANSDTTGTDTYKSATTLIADGAVLGDKSKAKVAIVMYSDYQCPYCQTFEKNTLNEIISNYVDTDKAIFVFRNYPLSFHGEITYNSAYAGECVLDQLGSEKLREFHSKTYLAADMTAVNTAAQELGVDMTKYNACVTNKTFKSRVDADFTAGQAAGVTGTPGFVVGTLDGDGKVTGKLIEGAYPFASFKAVIDEMLAK
jgi:protein-disulfide isomerase